MADTGPIDEAGKYVIRTRNGEVTEKVTIDVDSMHYDQNGNLICVKDDSVVGVFRWFESIVKA